MSFGFFTVHFITNDNFAHTLWLRFVDLFDPVFKVIEGLAISDRIDQDDSCCALVIGLGNGFEAFLSSSVPYLHFNFDAIDVNSFDFEVDTDSGDVRHFVLLIDVAEEDVSFSDCGVSYDD